MRVSGDPASAIEISGASARSEDGRAWFESLGPWRHPVSPDPDGEAGWIEGVRLVDAQLTTDEICAVAGRTLEISGWALEPDSGRETPIARRSATAVLDQRFGDAPCE